VVLDRRIEQLAVRLELHTQNLSVQQRAELRQIDEHLRLGVGVMSEHVVGIDRVARRVLESNATPMSRGERAVIALPGEALTLPAGISSDAVIAYAPEGDGTWASVPTQDESTLRIVRISVPPAV
jgi:hypothetical protein